MAVPDKDGEYQIPSKPKKFIICEFCGENLGKWAEGLGRRYLSRHQANKCLKNIPQCSEEYHKRILALNLFNLNKTTWVCSCPICGGKVGTIATKERK